MSGNKRITRRMFGAGTVTAGFAVTQAVLGKDDRNGPVLPGIWRYRFGTPEPLTPVSTRHYAVAEPSLRNMPVVVESPIAPDKITGRRFPRGYEIRFPLAPAEMLYGLGLQFQSLLQRGSKKILRVNADPAADLGDSHAPVPFCVSTHGYGVLVDTARYATFYCGNKVRMNEAHPSSAEDSEAPALVAQLPKQFERYHMDHKSHVEIEIPVAAGIDVYVFAGPSMREAVQRYVLFSGGGALPPRWGLGFWYRAYGGATQDEVLALADELRAQNIPCDVLGLEPGWQAHSYSCSFTWSAKFPSPQIAIDQLNANHYHVNLWEHAFTHPTAPFYAEMKPHAGDYEVWDGLVPDFVGPRARGIFAGYHDKAFIAAGISGFKLDECDNSDYTHNWSFPELSSFPSDADGEQMHCFFGIRYQDTFQSIFERRNLRTWGLVRSSHALAAPSPYTLYSDLYDHREFIRAVANAGFCGLLWCPEVRDAQDTEDLVRRLQTVIFSPLAMVNAWYIRNPPWKQVDREANNAGHFAPGWQEVQETCRNLIALRMRFVPYLYSAYVRYHETGMPPFRALVLDYPNDPQTWAVDDQYLMGESILVAPLVRGDHSRRIYLPAGDWFDFWTGQKVPGSQWMQVSVPLERIPLYVKSGTLLPLARVTAHTADPASFELTVRGYGPGQLEALIHEDDGSLQAAITPVSLIWREGQEVGTLQRPHVSLGPAYLVIHWERVPG